MGTRTGRVVAGGIAVASAVGLGLLAVPGGAGAAPELPPVSAQDLVASVIKADPGPFSGTVTLDNQLGLPALPNLPQAANGTSTARIWSGGDGKGRVQIPTASGERTLVADGTTVWSWDSTDRTVTTGPEKHDGARPEAGPTDPTAAATQALAALTPTSTIAVDGTAEVAGRPAYALVLAPKPTERTLLREVRIAVDAEKRVPLQLTVLAQGSSTPVLTVGFSDVSFAAPDPSLFTFTPPPGATVKQQDATKPEGQRPAKPADAAAPAVVGDGWDTVVVAKAPQGANLGQVSALGRPVSGAWGSGHEIDTAVATAIVTDDGRIAAGAVPEQVLTEALQK
jgi:outer membrane lipoprotein-sorting protein